MMLTTLAYFLILCQIKRRYAKNRHRLLSNFTPCGAKDMIRCHLGRLMGEKKMNIIEVAKATGANRSAISALYHETAIRVDLELVDRLCRIFNCSVSELFEFVDQVKTPKE